MIKEIWLTSEDGILINHGVLTDSEPIDPVLICGMFSAMQNFSEELTGKKINYMDMSEGERLVYIPVLNKRFYVIVRIENSEGERGFELETKKLNFLIADSFESIISIFDGLVEVETYFIGSMLDEPFAKLQSKILQIVREEQEAYGILRETTKDNLELFENFEKIIKKKPFNSFILDRSTKKVLLENINQDIFFSNYSLLFKILNEIKFVVLTEDSLNKVAFSNGILDLAIGVTDRFIYFIGEESFNLDLLKSTNYSKMIAVIEALMNEEIEYFLKRKKVSNMIPAQL